MKLNLVYGLIVLSISGFSLGGCMHSSKNQAAPSYQLDLWSHNDLKVWGQTATGDSIRSGGFSGLVYLAQTKNDELQFLTMTDRGPNGEPFSLPGTKKSLRPFLVPEFQPRLLKIETRKADRTFTIIEEILLKDPKGQPLSGLPQWVDAKNPRADENPVDTRARPLTADLMGIDPEGLAFDDEGFYWLSEEYRPSILKFDRDGKLVKRFIPKGSLPARVLTQIEKKYGKGVIVEALPEIYAQRKVNRGFEGLTYANGKLYAFLQSPLEIPNDQTKKVIRLVELDTKTEKVTGEYFFPLLQEKLDKIGDLAYDPIQKQFITILQNSKTGPTGLHLLQSFKLPIRDQAATENLKPELILSLADIGYDFAEKVEGLTILPDGRWAVINDNDFGVEGELDLEKHRVPLNPAKKSVLGIISVRK